MNDKILLQQQSPTMRAASKQYSEHYAKYDQSIWDTRSKLIIESIAKNIKRNYLYLPDLLEHLAKERNRLAVLQYDKDAALFGSFCTENMRGTECIKNGDTVRNEVLPIVEELFKHAEIDDRGTSEINLKNPFKHLFPKDDLQKKREKAIWASDVLHKNAIGRGSAYKTLINDYEYGFNSRLSRLIKFKDGTIGLIYRDFNKYNVVGDYFSAQALYDDLLAWTPSNSIDDFLTYAAKFSYFMTHCFFVRRGTASITEWIIRGVALHHGIILSDFKEDTIGWPWRALTTPNINDYITWYRENCFVINSVPQNCKSNINSNYSSRFFSATPNSVEVDCINHEIVNSSLV